MFDVGFPELVLIAVVGLLVIGPERLPEALRTLGLWLGRMRRSFVSVKNEIEKEIGMDEVRRQLHNEAVMDEMKRIENEVRSSADAAAISDLGALPGSQPSTGTVPEPNSGPNNEPGSGPDASETPSTSADNGRH
ncbi:MAG: Sec-independent protein translocase protein TatB [Gammaproteobacteria bacterium]|nr:Sec-independent protein translocase protein TatB [Gammaproteobacteria bacterium]